jgi:predicted Na+-dependent transporter
MRVAEMLQKAGCGTHLRVRESVMHRRATAATTAALLALFLVVLPASADTEYAGVQTPIDWRLVVILTVLALAAFYYVLEVMNPDH